MARSDVVLARRTEIGRRVDALSQETLRGLVISIHEAIWDPASDDYPDGPVSGAECVDAVADAFRYVGLQPKSEVREVWAVKQVGDRLSITASGVEDTPDARGRIGNIEMELLRYYGGHAAEPVFKGSDGRLHFQFWRRGRDGDVHREVLKILRGFKIEV